MVVWVVVAVVVVLGTVEVEVEVEVVEVVEVVDAALLHPARIAAHKSSANKGIRNFFTFSSFLLFPVETFRMIEYLF